MHIKQITISNFRSFKQQPEIQPFSISTNCVVGRNGSGKSNLFDAVQFVLLAPRFANLRQEERQAILHEGSGSAAVNAFVEIVFDNSDGRLSVDNSDEVVLRRTIGAKKDEFFLQRKRVNKTEVQSLLEGAGFSKSNPYYIVQQGKVQDLCTMSDVERLNLLKEVAGTTVYDEKKSESLLKMEENTSKTGKINEILEKIEGQLSTLQNEKEDLTKYQALDKSRRAIEYTTYDKEVRKARKQLDAIEVERSNHLELISQLYTKSKEYEEQITNLEGTCKTKTNELKRLTLSLRDLENDSKTTYRQVVKIESECQELRASIEAGEEQIKSNKVELEDVNLKISSAEVELRDRVVPGLTQARRVLQQLQDQQTSAQQQQEALYEKQGRGRQFQTREERDAFLKRHLKELDVELRTKDELRTRQQDRLANLRRTMQNDEKTVQSKTVEYKDASQELQGLEKQRDEMMRQIGVVQEQQKQQQRDKQQLSERVREAREAFHAAQSAAKKTTPRNTGLGLEALPRLVQELRLTPDQYMGTVMQNLRLKEERFATAVEVAANNALFHVIVDNDQTAARLMKRLEDGKMGRVTFLPMNQLRMEPQPPIPQNQNDIRSLVDLCVEYDPKVDRAMQHVFSKKLLGRTTEIASDYSTQHNVDVITLDGDLCTRKGSMTGGYVDSNQSRIKANLRLTEAEAKLRGVETELGNAKQQLQQTDQLYANIRRDLTRLEGQHGHIDAKVTDLEKEIERLHKKIDSNKKNAETIETKELPTLDRDVASLEAERGRLKEEIGTELTDTLSEAEHAKLEKLQQLQLRLVPQIQSQSEVVNNGNLVREKLESLLKDNLYRRREELTQGIEDDGNGGGSGRGRRRSTIVPVSADAVLAQRKEDYEEKLRQLEAATKIRESGESKLQEARKNEQALRKQVEQSKNKLERIKTEDSKNRKAIDEAQENSDKLWTKRSMCIGSRESYQRKIQELGSLPPPVELQRYASKSLTALSHALDEVNKELRKYSHVNKKAFDQYVNFNEQRETLLKRKEELDQGAKKVKELIESLDLQKDEAINRTFRGVSSHFKAVFKELVPNGAGELEMRLAVDETAATDNEDSSSDDEDESEAGTPSPKKKKQSPKKKKQDLNNPDVSLYRGVGIRVRFSAVGENYMMSQLSGGQKALVAMALIFAIQRCDPAPFYLLDELDQALDSTYRAAVASLIERQAKDKENPTQFIVSTFRPELVQVASRCYGISHQNKVSNIHPLSKRDALAFVANLMSEEEKVGDVATVPTARGKSSVAQRFKAGNRKRKTVEPPPPQEGGSEDEEAASSGATDTSSP